jgi:flagellar biosynthetic protein FliR
MLPATAFVLILTRVSAVVFTSPVLGAKSVPLRFRVVLSCLLSLAIIPIAAHAPSISTTGDFLNALFSEMVVGVMLGLGVTIMFVAAQAAANVIGQMAGMQWTNPADDVLGPAATPLSQLFGVISLAAFALIGGPELVISALLELWLNYRSDHRFVHWTRSSY